MAKPDTRKRDRAAYMRDYRAKRAKENPSLQAQIDALKARLAMLEAPVERNGFGSPRPAPKRPAKGSASHP